MQKYNDKPVLKIGNENTLTFFGGLNILINLVCSTDPYFQSESVECGIGLFILIGLFISVMTYFSFYIFSKSWQFGSGFSYTEVWVRLFGRTFSWIPSLIVFICYLSLFIAFSWELYNDASLVFLMIWPNLPEWVTGTWFFGYVGIFVLLLITVTKKKLSEFTLLSIISNVCMVIYFGVLLYITVCSIKENGWNPNGTYTYFSSDISLTKNAFSKLISCFFLHPIAHHIIVRLREPTLNVTYRITKLTMFITFFFNISCGIFSYIIIEPEDDNPLFLYEGNANWWLLLIGRIASVIRSYISAAGFLHLTSYELGELIFPGGSNTRIAMIVLNVGIALLVEVFNVCEDIVYDVFENMGTIAFLFLTFVVPPIFYFKTLGMGVTYMNILNGLLMLIGVLVIIILYII